MKVLPSNIITPSFQTACRIAVLYTFQCHYPEFKWHRSEDAPNIWKELKQYQGRDISVPINSVSDDANIYGSADGNIVFRAWHDAIHLHYNLGFDIGSEMKVAAIHREQMINCGVQDRVAHLICMDVAGQATYYEQHGDYVSDQLEFMNRIMRHGVRDALAMGKC